MSRSDAIEAELATLCRQFMAEETTTVERKELGAKIDALRAEFQTLNADAIAAAQVAFATTKPDSPEHVEFMRRAAEMYPSLPPGAQQNALHCHETAGAAASRRYVRNATARHQQRERDLMGTTFSAWRKKRSDEAAPYHYEGVMSASRRKEILANVARNAEYFHAGRVAQDRQNAQQRAKAERNIAKALGIEPKGDLPHQSPAAQVRALVRDKVRAAHQVVVAGYERDRGGAVYRLQQH